MVLVGRILTCFPTGIKAQEEFQPKFSVSPFAISKELEVTQAPLHKSRDNRSHFRSINEEIESTVSKLTRTCKSQLCACERGGVVLLLEWQEKKQANH